MVVACDDTRKMPQCGWGHLSASARLCEESAMAAEINYCTMWPHQVDRRYDGWEALLSAVVADSERMTNARCRRVERASIFDARTRADCIAALKACRDCPVIQQCNSWSRRSMRLSGQNGYSGVIAGQVFGEARQWLP
jgi:hypothetical protein